MLSIQSIMLMALGFLTATLLALTFAPALWSRAVRLTTRRIKERLPVTETEIRADKDRLRAEFAMTVHRLEQKIEQAELKRARHMIELNRRDASISQLESELTTVRAALEEHENSRRVLEHTISDRFPKVEARLEEARKLLATRDAEINQLASSTTRQQQALEEARSINAQQAAEIERLTTSIAVHGGRNRNALNDASVSGEIALRAELESLRAKARDQAAVIARLQSAAGSASLPAAAKANGGTPLSADAATAAFTPSEDRVALEKELRALKSKAEDQASQIKTLTAELTALRSAEAANTPDSKVALRARLAGLETQNQQHSETVARLRAELAAANERLALQGAHFMDQMRRLASAATPADAPSRADAAPARATLAERVANTLSRTTPADVTNDTTPSDATPAPIADPAKAAGSPSPQRLIDRISSLSKV